MWKKIRKSPISAGLVLIAAWRLSSGLTASAAARALWLAFGPLFASLCIAFVLNIPMSRLESFFLRRFFPNAPNPKAVLISRAAALTVSIFVIAGAGGLALFFCVADVMKSASEIGSLWPSWSESFSAFLERAKEAIPALAYAISDKSLEEVAAEIAKGFTGAQASLSLVFGAVLSGATNALISIFLAIFMLFNKEKLLIIVKRAVYAFSDPVNAEFAIRVSRLAQLRFRSFAVSLFLGAAIEGVNFLIALWVFGFPFPLTIASLLALLALVPILGAAIGFVVGTLLVAIAQPSMVIGFIAVFIAINQIDQQLIYPKIIGKAVGLDAFWALAAVSVGASLGGAVGIFFAVPVTSILYTIITEYVEYYIGEKNIPPEKYL